MPQTQLGKKAADWSTIAKQEFKEDADKLPAVPIEVLRTLADKIAKTYPACNPVELAALEVEQNPRLDSQTLSDAISVFIYLLDNVQRESPQAVIEDLSSLGLFSKDSSRILLELMVSAEPFREAAKVASKYLRIGSPLFVEILGTIDIRLRFHKTEGDFMSGKPPTALMGTHPVIMVSLLLNEPNGQERVVPFLMDENDLSCMKRFIRNMERELELSKNLLKSSEQKR